jgi:sterol desaturase/sphingolipid hydroxylase (fatty acid hydroxylase superfamily)
LLDRFTRVHPATPALVFVPVIAVLVGIALDKQPKPTVAIEIACGYLFWTLVEYWMHRAVFHFEPQRGIGARLHWIIHGVHHDHPNDPRRLVMPLVLSLPLGAAFFGLFIAAVGTPDAYGACGGFFAGYLLYDMVHFTLHHRRPKTRLGRRLRELHMRHHFEDDSAAFGVSAPWWDLVFGTFPDRARRSWHRGS